MGRTCLLLSGPSGYKQASDSEYKETECVWKIAYRNAQARHRDEIHPYEHFHSINEDTLDTFATQSIKLLSLKPISGKFFVTRCHYVVPDTHRGPQDVLLAE